MPVGKYLRLFGKSSTVFVLFFVRIVYGDFTPEAFLIVDGCTACGVAKILVRVGVVVLLLEPILRI